MSASSKEIQNIQAAIKECNGNHVGLALATVVDVEGSSYRRIGARIIRSALRMVQPDFGVFGRVSGNFF